MAKKTGSTNRLRKTLGLTLFAGLAGIAFKTVIDAGTFDRVWDHPASDCHLVKGLPGAEDLVTIPGTRKILVSVHDRKLRFDHAVNGIYQYDLDQPDAAPLQLTSEQVTEWFPHGIGYWHGDSPRLFVINHRHDQDHVEIFQIEQDSLILERSIPFPGIKTLNSVLPLGPDSFFVTQDLGSQTHLGKTMEQFLRIRGGGIWYFDGKESSLAADGLYFGNGLALSQDQRYLYVASMLDRSLMIYEHDPITHKLTKSDSLFLDTAPDNLRWTDDGYLLIGAHLRLFDLSRHDQDPAGHRAPAQVIAINGLPEKPLVQELYSSRGEPLSAVSVGIQVKNDLVMGSIYDDGILICPHDSWNKAGVSLSMRQDQGK